MDIVASLYLTPPAEFVAARTRAADDAKARGVADEATAIKALPKPTVAAWLVNLVAHRHPGLVERLLQLGGELREAQQSGKPARVRGLSKQRDDAIAELLAAIRRLPEAATVRKLPEDDLRNTFIAAVADPQVGSDLRAGRLAKAVTYSGFGGLMPVAPDLDERPADDLRAARDAETAARSSLTAAEHAYADAQRDLQGIDEELSRLARRRTAAQRATELAAADLARAEDAVRDAVAQVDALRAAADRG